MKGEGSARSKSDALKKAGAIVPPTFGALGPAIKETYQELLKSGFVVVGVGGGGIPVVRESGGRLRGVEAVIDKDLALMHMMASWLEKLSRDGKRLKPKEVVAEFDNYLHDELDMMHEAANASQLRRNFTGSPLLYVPEVHFDLTRRNVMVMERIRGVQISDTRKTAPGLRALDKWAVRLGGGRKRSVCGSPNRSPSCWHKWIPAAGAGGIHGR